MAACVETSMCLWYQASFEMACSAVCFTCVFIRGGIIVIIILLTVWWVRLNLWFVNFNSPQFLFPHKMAPFFRKSTTWNHKRQVLHLVEIDHARLLWTLQGKWVFTMYKLRAFSPSCWHLVMWSFWVAGNLCCSCQSH